MNKILEHIPSLILTENIINPARIYEINNRENTSEKTFYLITRNYRAEDNFAFNYCSQLDKNFEILLFIPQFEEKNKQSFFESQLEITINTIKNKNIKYYIIRSQNELDKFFETKKIGQLIIDFNPIKKIKLPENKFKITEIDSYNICPARFISDKQEYNASTLRRKIYNNIAEFITDFPIVKHFETEAEMVLKDFIENKLFEYAEYKNNPLHDVTSNLSKYINWGFISGQRIFLEILKAPESDINKETFFEELVIRQSLSDNFCLYNKKYKTLAGIPKWAKETLKNHSQDIRAHIYNLFELENAKTYDELWNASQNQLKKEGKIHGYMRMYWAKKILEWTPSAKIALEYAIYLNDKYAFDAPSANGYASILWSIGGLHDRAFANYPVTGKIRRMTYNGAKTKFDVKEYVKKYISL